MPNANWSNPTLTSTYTNFVTEVKARDEDLALQFDGTTATNLPTNTIRWSSSVNRWQKWSGSAWGELTSVYALTALSTTGNANVGGQLSVTGTAFLLNGATVTGTVASSSTISGTALVPTAATAPATAGLTLPASNTLGFATAGSTRARLTSTGLFAIGATTPIAALDVDAPASTPPAIFKLNTVEACRIDTSNRLLVGTATAINEGTGVGRLQLAGTDNGTTCCTISRFSADNDTPRLTFVKSRSGTVGTSTIAVNGDLSGRIEFKSSNGSNYLPTANITAYVDGTPGASSMPGGLQFSTTQLNATASDVRFQIERSGQMRSVVPGGATTLLPAFMARAWVNFNGTGTVAIRASGNVTSITDNGTGDYTINFNTAMPDTNYCIASSSRISSSVSALTISSICHPVTYNTGSVRIQTGRGSANQTEDHEFSNVAIFR